MAGTPQTHSRHPRYAPVSQMEWLETRVLLSGDGFTLPFDVPVLTHDAPQVEENEAPTANDDLAEATQDTLTVLPSVLANDTDPDGDWLRVIGYTQPSNGRAVLLRGGKFAYRPAEGSLGEDSFQYTISDGHGGIDTAVVTITVAEPEPNTDPVANDDAYTGEQDKWLKTGNVLANDEDADGDTLRVISHTQPENGVAIYNFQGEFAYRPTRGFVGTDTFVYTVGDGNGGTDTATVTITVAAAEPDLAPDAVDDAYTVTGGDVSVIGSVLENDTDPEGDRLRVTGFTQPDNGVLWKGWDGKFLYLPNADFDGEDTFEYTISDHHGNNDTAVVTITVEPAPVNTAPEAADDAYEGDPDRPLVTGNVLENDTDADGDRLWILSHTQGTHGRVVRWFGHGTFLYVPDAGWYGTDTFTYTIGDGNGGTDEATVSITIAEPPANEAPSANPDAFTVRQGDRTITDNVVANDTDPEGDWLRLTGYGEAEHGEAYYIGGGRFKYVADEDFVGDDTFTYTIDDGHGNTADGVVTVTVTENAVPVAGDDTITAIQDTPLVTEDLLANDTDDDGDWLRVTEVGEAAHGQVSYIAFGRFLYTPEDGYTGSDQFIYTIGDGHGGTADGVVTVDVIAPPPNTSPELTDDEVHTQVDQPVRTSNVLANDEDADGDHLRIVEFSQPPETEGTVGYLGHGRFLFQPAEGFEGETSFTYTVSDGEAEVTATVIVYVDPLAEPE